MILKNPATQAPSKTYYLFDLGRVRGASAAYPREQKSRKGLSYFG